MNVAYRAAASAALIVAALSCSALAEPGGNFYAGKTVTLVIGSGVGGSYDAGGRLVAQYLKKYIPGNPTIVAQNMPGASSVRAAEFIYNAAPRDGTTLGFIQPTVVLNKVLDPGAKYDPRGLNWVGRLQRMVFIGLARTDAPAHTIEEAKKRELVLAANAPTGPAVMVPMALNALIGTKFKTIRGYQSAADNFLALQRGEVQGIGSTGLADIFNHPELMEKKLINVLYVIDLIRSPRIPDVPTIVDLGQSDDDKKILSLLGNASSIGQAVMTPPDVPQDRIAVLRQAFAEMMKDPDLLADAQKRTIDPSWLSGPELQKLVASNFTTPPALVDKLKTIVVPR